MKRSELAISVSLVPLDYLMVIAAGIVGYYARFWEPIIAVRPVIFNLPFWFFFNWLLVFALIWTVMFALAGLYSMRGNSRAIDEVSKIIFACSTAVTALMFIFFFSRSLFDSRFIILAAWFFSILFVMLGRGLVRLIQRSLYRFGIGHHRIVIIGQGVLAKEIIASFTASTRSGFKVVNQYENFDMTTEKLLFKLKAEDRFDEILVASPHLSAEMLDKLNDFSYVNHVELKFIADIFDFPISNFIINNIAGLPVVEVKKTRLDGWGRIGKRIFDLAISALLIILLSPILIIVALIIKLTSEGPVFFTYKRIGEKGQPFTYFKFRSMVKDAHKLRFDPKFVKQQEDLRQGSPMMKFANDPRVTETVTDKI